MSDAFPFWMLPAAWTVLGLLVGSFLNVVIHRVPEGLSLVRPGSACPACGHPVRAYDNVPVLSWVVLRGRCRDCGAAISVRYPVVELVTAGLFGLSAWRFEWAPYLFASTLVVACGVALLMIDIDHQRLPFSITGFLTVGLVATLLADGLARGWAPVPTALLSTLVWAAVYGGVWLVTSGRGMGLGDVALAPVLGLALGWLGWGPSLVGLFGGFVAGAATGIILVVIGRADRRRRVPHGPFMLSGAGIGLFAGDALWRGYLALFGL